MVNTFENAKERVTQTPSLVIDEHTVRQNLSRLQTYADSHKIAIRPHTKTHKSQQLARMQLESGCRGLTVAKVGEAAVMSEVCDDILIAYPAIDLSRRTRIAELARNHTMRVALDSLQGIDSLAESATAAGSCVGVLVDVNVGMNRTGVSTAQEALALATAVARYEGPLRLDGIFFYPGHIWEPAQEQQAPLQEVDERLRDVIELWRSAGLQASIVSGGSTPTAYQSHWVSSQTEIRPGTHILNDMNTVRAGFCDLRDCGAAIVCTIVSTAVAGKAVIDAGSKTLTNDRNVTQPDSGFGHCLEYPAARITRLSEEHGELDLSDCANPPALGERVTIIPNHICPCVNLQTQMQFQTLDGSLTAMEIDTRGMTS